MAESNYKDAFLAEAREQLDNLNNGLLKLEKDPENLEYINQIFRACHTMKSSSKMMGYNSFSELSHKMEDLLSKVRGMEIAIDKEIIDTLFEGSDLLEDGLENITEKNLDAIHIDDMADKIDSIIKKDDKLPEDIVEIPEVFLPNDDERRIMISEQESGMNIWRVIIYLSKNTPFKGAKAHILLKKIEPLTGRIIHSTPSIDAIKEGKITNAFEIVISSGSSKEELFKVLDSVSETHPMILDPDEKMAPPESIFKAEKKKRDPARFLSKPIQSIKVDVKKLDSLVNLVGELLISNMRLKQISKDLGSGALEEVIGSIDLLTANIQEQVMEERMVPVGQVFSRFPRLVRDLAVEENKKVSLKIEGEEIELDRTVLDEIGEPLIHAIRNAIDHGIEDAEERAALGKPEEGTILLKARREKNTAVIEIRDDGKGIDIAKVVEKAKEKRLVDEKELASLSYQGKLNLIFTPGLSTKENVTEISGRGVGMDVVLSKIKKIGGNVRIYTEPDHGTTLELRLPLTLAIISSLITMVNGEKYAIPLSHVIMTIELHKDQIKTIQGNELTILRGEDVPIIRMQEFFNTPRKDKEIYSVVITERGDKKVGFIVDSIVSQQPILIKNLHKLVRGVRGIAGASILGDGRVCLILDIDNIS